MELLSSYILGDHLSHRSIFQRELIIRNTSPRVKGCSIADYANFVPNKLVSFPTACVNARRRLLLKGESGEAKPFRRETEGVPQI